jgi:hypothetical protein
MMRSALLGLFALLLAACPSQAQEAVPQIRDVPAGPATIRGRIVHEQGPGHSLEGVRVFLYALTRTGVPGVRDGVSDSDGRFAFEGVSNDPSTPYLVGAEYEGVAYSGSRVIFAPGELEHEVEIRVAEVMGETRHLKISRATLRLDWSGAQLDVSESLSIHNDSSQTFYVRAGDRGTKHTSLRAGLPEAAEGFRMPHGIEP